METNRTFSISTLGCKVNQYESERIREIFLLYGFSEAAEGEKADACVVNTCTVTHIADRKSRQKVRQTLKINDGGKIFVTGCAATNMFSGIDAIEGGDLVIIPNPDKARFEEFLRAAFPDIEAIGCHDIPKSSRTRAFLKTGDGCEHFCTYCIVPHVRGPLTSRPLDELLDEASKIASSGCREIVLTAIHLGAYGHGLSGGENLAMLLDKMASEHPELRIRLSSVEPVDFSADMIETMQKHHGICRHIHLPLQHASDSVLNRMNRDYTKDDFRRIVNKIRDIIPEVAVTVDIIVGFPGETDEDFRQLADFVREMKFYKCHIFKYSKRQGTPACSYPDQVPEDVKQSRSAELIRIAAEVSEEINRNMVGKTLEVLAESCHDGYWTGLSSEYARVRFKSSENEENRIKSILITGYDSDSLTGEIR